MAYANVADRNAIENEMPWESRELPTTTFEMLSNTASKFSGRKAVTFQLQSGVSDPDETFTWGQLRDKTAQTANLFRSLGVGENDVVAYLLPNASETVLTYLGGQVAGIVNPINPLLEAEQIAAILRETNAKVLVTLKAFPKTDVPQKAAEALAMAPNVKSGLVATGSKLVPPVSPSKIPSSNSVMPRGTASEKVSDCWLKVSKSAPARAT